MWAGSNAVGLIGLVLNVYMCMTWSDHTYIISIVPFVFLSSTWIFCSVVNVAVQVSRRKESISSCALPSESVCFEEGLLYAIVGTLPS